MQRTPILVAAALAAIAGLATLSTSAQAAGGIKAAYVEEVIPAKTFSGHMQVFNSISTVGPGANSGVLGITSITLTNFDTQPQQVFLFVPIFSGGGCGSASVVGGANPEIQVYVQPQSTMHLTYPTPFVINPVSGITCIGAEVTTILHGGSVEIDINGVVN